MKAITETAALLKALKGGRICDLTKLEDGIQFRIHLPEKADLRVEGSQYFLCKVSQVKQFSLQPFRNATTTIQDLAQIEQLKLTIADAQASEGELLKIWCSMGAGSADARLSIQAENLQIWDEAFDSLAPSDLN